MNKLYELFERLIVWWRKPVIYAIYKTHGGDRFYYIRVFDEDYKIPQENVHDVFVSVRLGEFQCCKLVFLNGDEWVDLNIEAGDKIDYDTIQLLRDNFEHGHIQDIS